jgi:hypothetical protein
MAWSQYIGRFDDKAEIMRSCSAEKSLVDVVSKSISGEKRADTPGGCGAYKTVDRSWATV